MIDFLVFAAAGLPWSNVDTSTRPLMLWEAMSKGPQKADNSVLVD